jgi:hypothetical protein
VTYSAILGHKHGRKHLTQYIATLLLFAVSVVAIPFPTPVWAFDVSLNVSPSPLLKDRLDTLSPGELMPEIGKAVPAHDFTSASVISAPSPVTATPVPTPAPKKPTLAAKVRPTLNEPVVMEGEASYYSRAGCLGCDPNVIMANGQPLNDSALTMAVGADKKHLVGYKAKVTNLATGQSVVALITDTGGFYQARYGYRVADLTIATKNAIGIRGGLGQVRVEIF